MTRRYAIAHPVVTGLLAALCVRPAFADAPACTTMAIGADASVTARWPGLVERVREAFEARDDIDRCARVAMTMRGDRLEVAAVLPDGRSAARSVSGQDDVVPTLEALLLVPQRSPPEASQPRPRTETAAFEASVPEIPPANTNSVAPRERSPPATPLVASPGPAPGPSASRLRIELSVMTGACVGDGQVGLGLGALSLLDVSGWLVGFEGRADRYQTFVAGTPGTGVLELAGLGGRRFRFRTIALDLIAGSALVLQGTTTIATASAPGNGGNVATAANGANEVTSSSSSTAPRLLLGARVNFGALSALRTFVGVNGELGPSRLGDGGAVPDVPRLPIWTLGLALGGTVGTL
jgi:hypothetical protein